MPSDLTPERVAQAIKATEYKYFGDYEMSVDQRDAVDVLVAVAQKFFTPTASEATAALHNAAEFLHFYFVGPDAAKNRAVEGDINMLAEAQKAYEVALTALLRA